MLSFVDKKMDKWGYGGDNGKFFVVNLKFLGKNN